MSKNTKKWLIVPGADHAMSYCVDKERYEVTAKDFWNEFDFAIVPQ